VKKPIATGSGRKLQTSSLDQDIGRMVSIQQLDRLALRNWQVGRPAAQRADDQRQGKKEFSDRQPDSKDLVTG
jgi:hypothetical protein